MKKILITLFILFSFEYSYANSCSNQRFNVTIQKELSIADALDNLAQSCGLSIVVKDAAAQQRLKKKLFYTHLKNSSLYDFLNLLLKDNDLNYKLEGNKLSISYLVTKTFKVHYISSDRTGSSNANINIANAGKTKGQNISSASGMAIQSNDKFDFWKKLKKEIHQILVVSGDGSMNFTKGKDGTWIDASGNTWQYNPLEPIVDPEGGLVTVTGTPKQLRRVERYINALAKQVKTQVLIDVKILSVTLNRDKSTGIDWSALYGLQNFAINTIAMTQKNIAGLKTENDKITEVKYGLGSRPSNAKLFQAHGFTTINDLIRFLKTQGDVKSISNPKIMTLNNQPALISVGKELFYKTKSSTSTKDSNKETTTSETIDSVFAGILLDITPEIDKRGMITLKINPSITETDGTISNSGTRTMPPDLIRRQISTVIKVKDGKHAILGGLISSVESKIESKVPLLGDMPLLGEAFKREKKIKRTEELVVIITPHITNGSKNLSLKSLGYRSIVK